MSLSAAQIDLVVRSHARVAAAAADYSSLFYHRLFQRHPFARSLFADDMTHQIATFRKTIDTLVAAVDDLPALAPVLADMARRHVRYGVTKAHYAFVGEVLIDTFAELAGDDFGAGTRAAWQALYADVAGVMIAAAYPVGGDPPATRVR